MSIKKNIWLSSIILICSIILSMYLSSQKRMPSKKAQIVSIQNVRVKSIVPTTHTVVLEGYGSLMPNYNAIVTSQTKGQINYLYPDIQNGAAISENSVICTINPSEYEMHLKIAEADLSKANLAVKQEMARNIIAKDEWELLDEDIKQDTTLQDLALRKEHLQSSIDQMNAASAKLQFAKEQLEATNITSPCNGLINKHFLAPKQMVNIGQKLAEISCTDELLLLVTIPRDQLRYLNNNSITNKKLADVTVLVDDQYPAKLVNVLNNVDSSSQMAQILLKMTNQSDLPLLGSYLKASIQAADLKNTYKVPEQSIDINNNIWIVENNQILSKPIHIVEYQPDAVIIQSDNLNKQISVVVSNLAYPYTGMQVNVID